MKIIRNGLLGAAIGMLAVHAYADVTFYEHENFGGRTFNAQGPVNDFKRFGFNDRASSVIVSGRPWEVCVDRQFQGGCVVLRPGRYASLRDMNLNDQVSSARPAARDWHDPQAGYAPPPAYPPPPAYAPPPPAYAPPPQAYAPPPPAYDWHRRRGERLYQVDVADVRAVYATPQQRCWVERREIVRDTPNVGGAIVGGVIGGILGHQIGGGTGRDLATAGGAVAGAAIGANVGRGPAVATRDVQRCASAPPQSRPDYWDVAYYFRGAEHHVQMTDPPGPTLTVNGRGEPRL